MTKIEVRDALYRELATLLPGWKLVKKDEAFVRAMPGGTQKIMVALVDYNPEFRFSLVLTTRLDAVEDIVNKFSGAAPKFSGSTLTSMTQLAYFFAGTGKKQLSVRSPEDIAAAMLELAPVLRDRILPFLDSHRTLATIDDALNGGDPNIDTSDKTSRTLHALTVARLANNPRFDELAAAAEQALAGFNELSRTKLSRLLAYLRSPDFANSTKDST